MIAIARRHANDELSWRPMDEAAARAIAGWRYAGAHALYNTAEEEIEATVCTLCTPQHRYFAMALRDGGLLGYCCFGEDARVRVGNYPDDALDIGMGIQPCLLGRGLGMHLLQQAIAFANREYAPPRIRATVAAFNERALRLCRSAGFRECTSFLHPDSEMSYVVLIRDATRVTAPHAAILQVEQV